MKLSKIVKRVDQLRDVASETPPDHLKCSELERELWAEVLHAFSMGKGSEAKAAAALETENITFQRNRAF